MIVVNEPLVRETLAWIELHPELWNQAWWAGVSVDGEWSHCFGAWAFKLTTGCEHVLGSFCEHQGSRPLPTAAAELLGLCPAQASALFHYISEVAANPYGGTYFAPVTFAQFCERVEQVTGIRFKPPIEVT